MNATTQAIISRLPDKPLLSPGEIAAALGLKSSWSVIQDIASGKLAAAKIGNRYIISDAEARRYVATKSVNSTEGVLHK